ncbi:hypothetical protein C5L14_11550 [Labrys okinawensis]|uniref:Lipoprotein n=1 Tax=Labrys okinawensis TaxID=346911 RepID=A0A2S9QD39_9HYPH|nr:hypothetical protein [Labrys okinawensis]PRH87262.1 hypothetical protein C5L14_11550 [Labrys okinawensis]
MRVLSAVGYFLALGTVAANLGGCSTPIRTLPGTVKSLPVVVVSQGLGGTLHGSVRLEQTQGSYLVSKGKFSCTGSYALSGVRERIYVPILCSDGRKGTASVHNDPSLMSGTGSFTMSDGSTGEFAFGNDAKKF